MVVAGVDASTKATGLSIMQDGELIYHTLFTIDPRKEPDAEKRVKIMLINICAVLDNYDIDVLCMEKAIGKGGNVDTVIKLAYLSGGMSLYCIQNDIEFNNPTPSMWRKIVGISQGRGIKRDVQKAEAIKAVKDEYGVDEGDDVAESILIARSAFDLPKLNITEDDLWE